MQLKVFEGQRALIGAIFLCSLFVNLLILTAPLYMIQLFSRVIGSGSMSTLAVITIGACVALLFYFLFDALRQKLVSRLGNRLEANLGPMVMSILVQAASATSRRGAQPILDLQEVRRFVIGPTFTAVLDAPWSILFVAVIFMFDPVLGYVALIGIAILAALGFASELAGRAPERQASETMGKANANADEMLRNADVVRAMGMTPTLIERWKALSMSAMATSTQAVDRIAVMSAAARTIRLALQIAILGVGVLQVLRGETTPGAMIAASILLARAAAPVEQTIAGWRQLIGARGAASRLNAMLGAVAEGSARMEMPEPVGRLSVENATVVVPDRQNPLIFDVSFALYPGDSLGLIGPSGAGKTMVARALAGLQPLSRGYVRIDDAALTDWPADQIGRYIGYLPQRVDLFDGTIAENIAMMDPDAAPSAIVSAAKRAEVHDLILSLPGGYNAEVGLRGELLSAGQRQRIGLARAFYGDKRLIVLDEPNANLDPDGEDALARAVANACSDGAVVVVVTHRMNILRQLTHAAIMQGGRMIRFGKARDIINSDLRPMGPAGVPQDDKVTLLRGGSSKPLPNGASGGADGGPQDRSRP